MRVVLRCFATIKRQRLRNMKAFWENLMSSTIKLHASFFFRLCSQADVLRVLAGHVHRGGGADEGDLPAGRGQPARDRVHVVAAVVGGRGGGGGGGGGGHGRGLVPRVQEGRLHHRGEPRQEDRRGQLHGDGRQQLRGL